MDSIDGLFTKQTEISIYRVVQEAVNNIIKHSKAREARCAIQRQPGAVELKIEDNGLGFTRAETDGDLAHHGFGLFGIAERVRLMGGTCIVDSCPGQGTTIVVKLLFSENGHKG